MEVLKLLLVVVGAFIIMIVVVGLALKLIDKFSQKEKRPFLDNLKTEFGLEETLESNPTAPDRIYLKGTYQNCLFTLICDWHRPVNAKSVIFTTKISLEPQEDLPHNWIGKTIKALEKIPENKAFDEQNFISKIDIPSEIVLSDETKKAIYEIKQILKSTYLNIEFKDTKTINFTIFNELSSENIYKACQKIVHALPKFLTI
ncbi:MAG: hypothetical protein MUC49_19325 [Raineya sp.]|jgi:hypothetical protein|nr:hypothetical protein [Raineya sp.]